MIYSWQNPENYASQFPQEISSNITVLTLLVNIINISWAPNQHIQIISEGSFDTKDWSNNAEKSAFSSLQ